MDGYRPVHGVVAVTLRLRSNMRVLVVAMTGSGKTTLARTLSSGFAGPRAAPSQAVLVVDCKREPSLAELVPQEARGAPPPGMGGWWRVCPPDGDAAEPILEAVWRRGHTWLWIDELSMIGDHRRCPRPLELIYRQGRARNIGILALTQDPLRIPVVAKSQADAVLVGPIGAPDYVSECARMLHMPHGELAEALAELPRYGFLWWTWDHARERRRPDVVALGGEGG